MPKKITNNWMVKEISEKISLQTCIDYDIIGIYTKKKTWKSIVFPINVTNITQTINVSPSIVQGHSISVSLRVLCKKYRFQSYHKNTLLQKVWNIFWEYLFFKYLGWLLATQKHKNHHNGQTVIFGSQNRSKVL